MLFQTLVQLNILILATPALAGWSLLPMAQPGVVRAACVGFPSRTVEAISPKPAAAKASGTQRAVRHQTAVLPRLAAALTQKPAAPSPGFCVSAPADVVSFNPFSHAARAP